MGKQAANGARAEYPVWGHDEHFEVEAEKEEAKAARDAAQPSRQKTEGHAGRLKQTLQRGYLAI